MPLEKKRFMRRHYFMTSGNGSNIRREFPRILFAILSHRGNAEETENAGQDKWQLAEILYDADKISRACYTCPAEKDCNWSGEKKNQKIIW